MAVGKYMSWRKWLGYPKFHLMPLNCIVLHKWLPSTIWLMMVLAKWRYLPFCLFVFIKPIYTSICGSTAAGNYEFGKREFCLLRKMVQELCIKSGDLQLEELLAELRLWFTKCRLRFPEVGWSAQDRVIVTLEIWHGTHHHVSWSGVALAFGTGTVQGGRVAPPVSTTISLSFPLTLEAFTKANWACVGYENPDILRTFQLTLFIVPLWGFFWQKLLKTPYEFSLTHTSPCSIFSWVI